MDEEFAQTHGFIKKKLPRDIEVYHVNGTLNQNGSITEQVQACLELSG